MATTSPFVKQISTFSDYGVEAKDIDRQRKMAELLQQQSAAPIEERPGVPISWTQGLAKMLQAYYGKQGIDEATQKEKDLAGRAKMEAQDYFGGMPQAKTTDLNPVSMDDEGNAMPPALQTTQPTRQEMMSYALKGSMSGNPLVQPVAGSMLAQYMKPEEDKVVPQGASLVRGSTPIYTAPFRPPTPPVQKTAQPGDMRQRIMGDQTIEEEFKPDGTWQEVGRGPRFARQVPPVVVTGGSKGAKAPTGYRFSSDGETLEPIPGGPKDLSNKQLPTQALKLQQAELDAIGTGASIVADLSAVNKQIDEGKIDLGLVSNLVSQGRTAIGAGNEQSRNFNSFLRTLEKMRNDSLRLNKGVQTEGDSVRAWNELMGGLNDKSAVQQRLKEIADINSRAIALRKMNIDAIRSNYQVAPMDVSGYENQSPAVGKGGGQSPPTVYSDTEKERRYQEWKRKNGG